MLDGLAQLREQDRLAGLLLIYLVHDGEHLFRVWSDPQCSYLDLLVHEFNDLFLKDKTLRVTKWIPIIKYSIAVILKSMSRVISNDHSVASFTLPLLFQSLLKTPSHILRKVDARLGPQSLEEFLRGARILSKGQDHILLLLPDISVGDDRDPDLYTVILRPHILDNGIDFFL